MRRFLVITWVVCLGATSAAAQQPSSTGPATAPGARRTDATAEEEDIADFEAASPEPSSEESLPPQLRAPSVEGLQLPSAPASASDDEFDDEFDEGAVEGDMAADDAALLGRAAPPAADPTLASWTNPRPVFTLNGNFRVRAEYLNNISVRRIPVAGLTSDPFTRWIPIDNSPTTGGNGVLPQGGCNGPPSSPASQDQRCDGSAVLRYADMRLRLQPTLSLSDNVRLHMMVDFFQDLVLGSTPDVKSVNQVGQIPGRAPGVPVDTLTLTVASPESFRNTVGDNIVVVRAWAEVTNSTIGQLRFGRMGNQWGLGMLWNAGEATNPLETVLDQDFQSDVDRIQLIGKFKGIFFGVSWDFANKGYIYDPVEIIQNLARDASTLDDTRQWSFLLARRMDPLAQEKRLLRGQWVFNGGGYFIYRSQFLSTSTAPLLGTPSDIENSFVRRDANVYIPDGWFQALWKDLRLELEFAGFFGQIQNISPSEFPPAAEGSRFKLRQWGLAFEGEYRVLKKKLGIHLHAGMASGDPDVVGLSQYEDLATQPVGKKTVSTFSFHPNYRIDLILWRRIMGRIAGAYYLAPSVSYDLIRTDFGRVLGARLDFIYSRAMYQQQTYSSEPNLGAEIDIGIYYRTEDGPKFTDGFYAATQFGILFPLAGLNYLEVDGVSQPGTEGLGISRAMNLRLILGIEF
ncbi:MAG: TIGR04551 family protein [Polyangiales bacterium]